MMIAHMPDIDIAKMLPKIKHFKKEAVSEYREKLFLACSVKN